MKLEELAKQLKEAGFSGVRYSGDYDGKMLFEPISKDQTAINGNPQYVAYQNGNFTFVLGEQALQALDHFIGED